MAKLTNELAELTEKLDDMKVPTQCPQPKCTLFSHTDPLLLAPIPSPQESFESKDSGIHDTSPLVRIKAALQQIKQESCAFDLRIGVVSHLLLAARVSATHHRRVGAANKAKQRHSKRGKAQEDSMLSDD